jgi:hypothetical protein
MDPDGKPETREEQDALWAQITAKIDHSDLFDISRPWVLTIVAYHAIDACRQVGFDKSQMLEMVEKVYKGAQHGH